MRKSIIFTGVFLILVGYLNTNLFAGPPLPSYTIDRPCPQNMTRRSWPQPHCGIEITCTDKPVQLGYSDGVCFRASCPGIWAVLHKRVDQASFRKRIWTYRHFTFKGHWKLVDQGAIQSRPVELREMFLVLPDDLIEFRLRDPDKYARVELRNLGYVKRGDLCELKKWLAGQSYREGPALIRAAMDRAGLQCNRPRPIPACSQKQWPTTMGARFFSGLSSMCRSLGLNF